MNFIHATCRLCVDICPEKAMVMDDEMLGLDEDACTACGLCQAVCPQNAISLDVTPREQDDTLLLICDKAKPEYGEQRVKCVHQMGLEQIAGYYQKGVRNILVAKGDCQTCHYQSDTLENKAQTLDKNCQQFNLLVQNRNLKPISINAVTVDQAKGWTKSITDDGVANLSRRKLFTGVTEHFANETTEPETGVTSRHLANLQELNAEQEASLFFTVPQIDENLCEGCDACVRICPTQTLIKVNEEPSQSCYKVLPQNCTGCGLCQDVCSVHAICLLAMSESKTRTTLLQAYTCASCGIVCHVPGPEYGSRANEGGLCRICSQTGHHKKLFQVLA